MKDPIKPHHYAREADRQTKLNIREHMNSNQALGALAIRIANEHVYNEESDRQYFDRKHESTGVGPGSREHLYYKLADIEHDPLPIDEFMKDFVCDDPKFTALLIKCLCDEVSNRGDTVESLGRQFKNIVKTAFNEYVSLRGE